MRLLLCVCVTWRALAHQLYWLQQKKTEFDIESSHVQWILGGFPAPTEMEGVPGEQNEIHLKEEVKEELQS